MERRSSNLPRATALLHFPSSLYPPARPPLLPTETKCVWHAYTCRTRAMVSLVSLRYCHAKAITQQHCILCQQFVLTDWWHGVCNCRHSSMLRIKSTALLTIYSQPGWTSLFLLGNGAAELHTNESMKNQGQPSPVRLCLMQEGPGSHWHPSDAIGRARLTFYSRDVEVERGI